MSTLRFRTNASRVTDLVVNDLGWFLPAAGAERLSLDSADDRLQVEEAGLSVDLETWLTDDAYGAGSSTVILDDGTTDIAQGSAMTVIQASLTDFSNEMARDSGNDDLLYVGRSDSQVTSNADWQIYRHTVSTGAEVYADGDQLFDNIWDNRESLSYS